MTVLNKLEFGWKTLAVLCQRVMPTISGKTKRAINH
jgi:hypothetical protein